MDHVRRQDRFESSFSKRVSAFNDFWQDLLNFVERDLEPIWGHLHKGHILFRLGLARLLDDVSAGRKHLELALEEDRLLEKKRGTENVENAIRNYSSYAILCIIERIENERFSTPAERQRFFQYLFPSAYDAAISGKRAVSQPRVEEATKLIVPQQGLDQVLGISRELDLTFESHLPIATVSLTGTFLEGLLFGILYYEKGKRTVKGKDILRSELGPLLEEALQTEGVFPSDAVRVACQTIHIFRNRLHPGNELSQKYKLTEKVASTVKNLLDLALVQWPDRRKVT